MERSSFSPRTHTHRYTKFNTHTIKHMREFYIDTNMTMAGWFVNRGYWLRLLLLFNVISSAAKRGKVTPVFRYTHMMLMCVCVCLVLPRVKCLGLCIAPIIISPCAEEDARTQLTKRCQFPSHQQKKKKTPQPKESDSASSRTWWFSSSVASLESARVSCNSRLMCIWRYRAAFPAFLRVYIRVFGIRFVCRRVSREVARRNVY